MKTTSQSFIFLLFVCGVFGAETGEVKAVSVMEGDSVTLNPDLSEIHTYWQILWRFGNDIIAEIDGGKTLDKDDGRFKGRLQLDSKTASLTITNTRMKHSGSYELEAVSKSASGTKNKKFSVTVYESPSVIDVGKVEVKPVSLKEGDPVTLQTDVTETHRDELIVWRFGDEGKLIAKHDIETKNSTLYDTDERFRDRLKLDQTGSLTITNTRTTDSELYTVKISSSSSKQTLQKRFIVTVSEPGLSRGAVAGIVVGLLLVFSAAAAAGVFYHRLTLERQKVETVSVMEGESVTLNTDVTEIHRDDLIQWRFGKTLIAEIKGGTISIYDDVLGGRFRGKLKLDKTTGSLIITNTRTINSGLYELKISKDSKIKYNKFIVSVCVETVSVMEGDPVTLNTDVTEIHRDDLIQWRFRDENSLIAEIKEGTISTYDDVADGIFRGRLKLDMRTGSLIITDTEIKHMGDYKLQIRSSSGDSYKKFPVTVRMRNISVEEGEPVTLEPDTEIQKDDQILWKFGDQGPIIAQIKGGKGETHDDPDERFKNRLILDEKTGSLTITNVRIKHSGLYKLQIISNRGTTDKRFLVSVSAKTVSVMEGETVTLNTDGTEIHRDDLIEWRFGDENSLIAEIKGTGEISTYDGRFRGRLELDKKTGTLTITNTRTADSGDYQLLIRSSSGESSKKIRVHVMIPKISVNVGNDVTLNTDAEIQTDDLILWTFGAKNAVIAYMTGQTGGKHVPDERFRDRLEVDKKTGSLTITNMRNEQSGDYQLQIGSSRGTLYKKFRVCVVYRSDGKAPPSPRSSSLKALKSGSDGKAPPSPRSSPLKAQKSVIPESTTVEVDTPLLSGMVEVNEQQETSSL